MLSETLIVFPPFRLDVLNEQLWRDNSVVPVRPKPFAVLAYLATHPGRLVTAAELRKVVWPNTYISEGLLRSYIREVRVVLRDDAETPRFIETVPRRGYRFLPALTTPQPVVSSQWSVVSEEGRAGTRSQLTTGHWHQATSLVGRDTELTQLTAVFTSVRSGSTTVSVVLFVDGTRAFVGKGRINLQTAIRGG